MKNHSLQLWVLNLFLKGKRSGQNMDLSYKAVGTLLYWHTFALTKQNETFFCSNGNNQRGKPVLKILFFWTSTFFWRVLDTVWKQNTKKLLWDWVFLYTVKVLPNFQKQLGKVPSFSWPCQPRRERTELEGLSSPKRHNKIHRRKMTLHSQILCAWFTWRDGWRVNTTHLGTKACVKTVNERHKGKQTRQALCTGLVHSYCIINICIYED